MIKLPSLACVMRTGFRTPTFAPLVLLTSVVPLTLLAVVVVVVPVRAAVVPEETVVVPAVAGVVVVVASPKPPLSTGAVADALCMFEVVFARGVAPTVPTELVAEVVPATAGDATAVLATEFRFAAGNTAVALTPPCEAVSAVAPVPATLEDAVTADEPVTAPPAATSPPPTIAAVGRELIDEFTVRCGLAIAGASCPVGFATLAPSAAPFPGSAGPR
jgi:hypothetical protein